MNGFESPDDQQPVTWLRGYPVYAVHLVVAVFVASMLVTTVLQAASAHGVLAFLPFSSEAVLRGEIWRVATYGFFNPPSLWFAIDMLMIAWFGRELERFFGRNAFLKLYACLYLLPPVLLTVLGLWRPTTLAGQTGGFALFIAFATLYPNAPMLFNLLAKWVAMILFGLFTLMALADNDWVRLISLWATAGFAHASVRAAQGRLNLPTATLRRPEPK
ncbi:MAG TPA: rhomboid family intramembrane serine protease, partial [Opitutus sp.]|nr:rhomboid family intramembrane serine protease [Opitutus sp.]